MLERVTWAPILALALGAGGTACAQLEVFPARQRLDSLVVTRPDMEVFVVFPAIDSPAGWSVPLTDLVRRSAEACVGGALRAAEEAGSAIPGMGPSFENASTRLEWATSELIVLRDHSYSYGAGAAHGESRTLIRLFQWHKEELKPTTLPDLLDWNRDLRLELNRQIEGQLRLLGASNVITGGWEELDSKQLAKGAPTGLGLLYIFDPYEMGSHAEGEFEVLIPWRVLATWIPADGRLDRMLRARP